MTAAARVDGVRVIDATDQFCLADVCPRVIGDVLVYRNSGHVTASFAATLGPWLGRRLARRGNEHEAARAGARSSGLPRRPVGASAATVAP